MEKRPVLLKVELPFRLKERDHFAEDMIVGWDSGRMRTYVQALIREMLANAGQFDDCQVQAVRYGGGTASMAGQALADISAAIHRVFDVAPDASVTMSAAVSNISGATFPFFKRAGVQRFDMEMMALFQPIFSRCNNVDAFDFFAIACDSFLHAYANDTLGLVLAYGIGGVSMQDFRRSCLAAAGSDAVHVSFLKADKGDLPSPDETAAQEAQAREVFGAAGFVEYLPMRFARPGHEDRFLASYAAGADVLAFGLGAETRFGGIVSTNTSDFDTYANHSTDYTKITVATRKA